MVQFEHPAELLDADLANEIGLVSDLVLAAAECDGPLSSDSIDKVLGVGEDNQPDAPDAAHDSH